MRRPWLPTGCKVCGGFWLGCWLNFCLTAFHWCPTKERRTSFADVEEGENEEGTSFHPICFPIRMTAEASGPTCRSHLLTTTGSFHVRGSALECSSLLELWG